MSTKNTTKSKATPKLRDLKAKGAVKGGASSPISSPRSSPSPF